MPRRQKSTPPSIPRLHALPEQPPLEGVDEATWVDVIHKMDEVYSQLVRDEIALEEENAQLERSQQFIFSLLSAMSDVLVACNHLGEIEETNTALRELVGIDEAQLHGMPVYSLMADAASAASVRAHFMGIPSSEYGPVGSGRAFDPLFGSSRRHQHGNRTAKGPC